MSSARITGLIAAAVFAALLVWVAVLTFTQDGTVLPSVRVEPRAGAATSPQAAEPLLAERSRLQSEAAVASGAATEKLAVSPGRLEMEAGVDKPRALVAGWTADKPADADTFLRPPQYIEGISSLPYENADLLVQPEGRDWRQNHNGPVRYGGGWLIFGICLALALFLWSRGRIGVREEWSGRTIERFNDIERANHWMTAVSFLLMGLTGLVILYGKPLLLPIMNPSAFSALASWSAWVHMAAAVPFILGVVLMIIVWIGDQIPNEIDWHWLKRGGGFLHDDHIHPPAERFNAGQKVVFWGVVLGAVGLLATGLTLMFPFYWFGIDGMQWAQLVHAVIGLAMIALILGHIYIGSIGMKGAFSAMWSGHVDRTWAKEHHGLWYQDLTGERGDDDRVAEKRDASSQRPAPAE
jgi:formate dehydrogenase subunit gamma